MVRYDTVWCGTVRYVMAWHGMVWYGMVLDDILWCVVVCVAQRECIYMLGGARKHTGSLFIFVSGTCLYVLTVQ